MLANLELVLPSEAGPKADIHWNFQRQYLDINCHLFWFMHGILDLYLQGEVGPTLRCNLKQNVKEQLQRNRLKQDNIVAVSAKAVIKMEQRM